MSEIATEGPPLQALTHRLTECPPDFLLEPRIRGKGKIDVAAVVSDLSRDLGGSLVPRSALPADDPAARNRLRIVLIASWLLHDDWFIRAKRFAAPAAKFLTEAFADLAPLVDAEQFVNDPDRREELVRLALRALGLRPAGETEAQAADRFNTLNSVERSNVIRETRAAQERVRQIREAMKKKAAEEAAAAYGRE